MENRNFIHYKKINLTDTKLLMASEEGKMGNYTSQSEMDKKVQEWLK